MNFDTVFRAFSYVVVVCGFSALCLSGSFGIAAISIFVLVLVAGWFLEGTRWQISERIGTGMIVLALPVFYLGWRLQLFGYGQNGALLAGILGRLVVTLSAIKILQQKSDRDYIFLYLMAFFEVLLAAGMSISAMYLGLFVVYAFTMICTIILFEIKNSRQFASTKFEADKQSGSFPIRRLPTTAIVLMILILAFALPTFFLLPRVGGAGFGDSSGGISAGTGFSDTVKLGGIGRIQQNSETIMRVRLDGNNRPATGLRWRGIALDTFDNISWSRDNLLPKVRKDRTGRDFIQLDYASDRNNLIQQTIYLEPLDTPVLFALPKLVGVQGNFPSLLKDSYGAVTFPKMSDRISYKALSDPTLPNVEELRADKEAYPDGTLGYLTVPNDLDSRIAELAKQITKDSTNRYDAARSVERYLQNNLGYTLEQKASGPQPVADFLFNVKEGHCEYFATAMALMLRTQGIATRLVNGFSQGEYNSTADVYVIKQKNAHSWVEVYFPREDVWVSFDPTPFAGQELTSGAGLAGRLSNYVEAFEMFWIQYFVAFDNQEQRSLFASVKRELNSYQNTTGDGLNSWVKTFTQWWSDLSGDQGSRASWLALGYAIAGLIGCVALCVFLWRLYLQIKKREIFAKLRQRLLRKRASSVVEFYQQMLNLLEAKGMRRSAFQTPLEFAYQIDIPEAVKITEKYNSVRYGGAKLTKTEAREVADWLAAVKSYGEKS